MNSWNFTNDVTDEVDEDNIQINLDSIQQTAQVRWRGIFNGRVRRSLKYDRS